MGVKIEAGKRRSTMHKSPKFSVSKTSSLAEAMTPPHTENVLERRATLYGH